MDHWHLNVKEENISLTENYCIIISIQKFSSIHQFVLMIKLILGFHELKVMSIFDYAHPEITELNLASLNLYHHAQNLFIPSVHFCEVFNYRVP